MALQTAHDRFDDGMIGVMDAIAEVEPSERDWTDAVEMRPDLVSAVVAIQKVDILKAHVDDRGQMYCAEQDDRAIIYNFKLSQLDAERQRSMELEDELRAYKERRMSLQGQVRQNRKLVADARIEENQYMEHEQTARRTCELHQRQFESISRDHSAAQKNALQEREALKDELCELRAKHSTIRRKLVDGTRGLVDHINQLNKQRTAVMAANKDEQSTLTEQQRTTRQEAKDAEEAATETAADILEIQRNIVGLSKMHDQRVEAARNAVGQYRDASEALELSMSPRSKGQGQGSAGRKEMY